MKTHFLASCLCAAALLHLSGCGEISAPAPAAAAPVAPAAAAVSFCEQPFTQTEHFAAGLSIDGQNGWMRTAAGFDEQVENIGPLAQSGQNVWKLGNKVVSGAFGEQPKSPQLA